MTSVAEGPIDLAAADLLLSTTRAVRRRLDFDRPVEREVLLDCVRLAQQAPTGGNAQGWTWVIVTDAMYDLHVVTSPTNVLHQESVEVGIFAFV